MNIVVRILSASLIIISLLSGQATLRTFTKEQGLISEYIGKIYADSKGNIWCGVSDRVRKGIMKYDGEKWTNYFNKKDIKSIILVTNLFEDSKGTLWVGSRSAEYIIANGIWKANEAGFEKLSKIGTYYIEEDLDGNIWFGGRKVGYYDGNKVKEFSKKEIGTKRVTALYCNPKGKVWIGTKKGAMYFDGKGWSSLFASGGYPQSQVNSILSDRTGNMWFGADDGVYRYDGENWQHYTEQDGLASNGTLFLKEGINGDIFAVAGKQDRDDTGFGIIDISRDLGTALAKTGLSIFKEGNWQNFSNRTDTPEGISPYFIEDSKGELWFNSNEGIIYKYDGNNWINFNELAGCNLSSVTTLLEDSSGNIWLGSNMGKTADGVARYDGNDWLYFTVEDGLPSPMINGIVEGNDGSIWIATGAGVVQILF